MRNAVIVVFVLTAATIAAAFAPIMQQQNRRGSPASVTAMTMERHADTLTMSGDVTVVLQDGTKIVAADAVMNTATRQIEMHGTVRVTLPPDARMVTPVK